MRQHPAPRLLPHQLEGIQFGREARGRLLLADGMGLGKTLQAIMIAATFPKDFPALIVVPACVLFNFKKEIHRWLPDRSVALLRQKKDLLRRTHGFVVGSYDMLRARRRQLADHGFGIVICDECHFLKNPEAQRTRAAQEVLLQVRRRILLSGTPSSKHAVEMFTQLHTLLPQRFPNYIDFGNMYSESAFGKRFRGANEEFAELVLSLQETCVLRRTADMVLSLPAIRREKFSVACPWNDDTESLTYWSSLRRHLSGIQAAVKKRIANLGTPRRRGGGVYSGNRDELARYAEVLSQRCRDLLLSEWHLSGRLKVSSTIGILHKELAEPTPRILVFAHHKDVLDDTEQALTQASVGNVRIDGRTSMERRERLIERFQSGAVRVALLSMSAMAQGINMTAATHAVIAELPWTPALFQQALGRMHRIGQKRETRCLVVTLGQPALDEHMLSQLEQRASDLAGAGIMEPLRWDTTPSLGEVDHEQLNTHAICFKVFVRQHLKTRLSQRHKAAKVDWQEQSQKLAVSYDAAGTANHRLCLSSRHDGNQKESWIEREKQDLQQLKAQWASLSEQQKLQYLPEGDTTASESKRMPAGIDLLPTMVAQEPQRREFSSIPRRLELSLYASQQGLEIIRSKVLRYPLVEVSACPPTMHVMQRSR